MLPATELTDDIRGLCGLVEIEFRLGLFSLVALDAVLFEVRLDGVLELVGL